MLEVITEQREDEREHYAETKDDYAKVCDALEKCRAIIKQRLTGTAFLQTDTSMSSMVVKALREFETKQGTTNGYGHFFKLLA